MSKIYYYNKTKLSWRAKRLIFRIIKYLVRPDSKEINVYFDEDSVLLYDDCHIYIAHLELEESYIEDLSTRCIVLPGQNCYLQIKSKETIVVIKDLKTLSIYEKENKILYNTRENI